MPDRDAPVFAHPDAEAPWRPDAELLATSRLTGLLHATGHRSLEELQARAVADPGWFWGAVAHDLGLAWGRPPTTVLDIRRGAPFARWWLGGRFDHAAAALAPWRSAGGSE